MAWRSASATARPRGTRGAARVATSAIAPPLFAEMLHDRGDAGLAHRDILLAVAARGRDGSDALAIDEDGKAADEDREAAVVLGHDAEGLLAGYRILVVVGRLAVAGGGERLVHRDLHARHFAAVEPAQRDRVAGVVGDADHFGHAE